MSAEPRKHVKKMHPDEVLKFVREHEDPAITAKEVANEFNATNAAATYRLKQLRGEGRLEDKQVGSSSVVWYPVG